MQTLQPIKYNFIIVRPEGSRADLICQMDQYYHWQWLPTSGQIPDQTKEGISK